MANNPLSDFLNSLGQVAKKDVGAAQSFLSSITGGGQNGPQLPVNPNVPQPATGSLAPDSMSGQSAQLTPQVAAAQQQTANAITNKVVTSPGGRFVGAAAQATDPNNGDTYGAAEKQHGGYSPEALGALVGSALPALGIPEATVGQDLASVPRTLQQGKAELYDSIAAAHAQPGGLQAGFIRPSSYITPTKAGIPLPTTGGKFINEAEANLTGGTPAKVKAKTSAEPDMQYVPPTEPDVAPQEPTPLRSTYKTGSEPNAEQPPTPINDFSRTHDINHPDYAPTSADLNENIKRNLVMDGDDIKTPQEQEQVNATYNGYEIKGTQAQQSRMAQETIGTLAKRAKAKVAAIGGTINKNGLINELAKNLIKVSGRTDIDPNVVMKVAEDEINAAYGRVKGVSKDGKINNVAPDEIPGIDAQDMKRDFNSNVGGTFGVPVTSWTKAQKTARPARDALDNLLDQQYPEASKLNNDMSDLYKGQESLRKGANAEGTAAQKAMLTQENKPPSWWKQHAKTVGLSALGTLGTAVIGGAVYELPRITALNKQNKANNTLPPLPKDGNEFSADTPLSKGQIMDDNAYRAEKAKQQSIMDQTRLTDPTGAYATAQAAYDKNETNYTSQQKVRETSTNTAGVVMNANEAEKSLRSVNLDFFNALSKGYDSTDVQNNPEYAALATQLQSLQQATKLPLDKATNKKTLDALIQKSVKAQQIKQKQAEDQYSSSGDFPGAMPITPVANDLPPVASHAPVNWQTNAPQVNAIMQGYTPLPAIQ